MLIAGIVLLALGLGSLGWFAWEYWGTNIAGEQAQREEKAKLRERWESPATESKEIGDGIALMRIPEFGADWEQPILIGITPEVLMRGLGWYDTTAEPGQIGNFAVAGHRSGNGRPFDKLLDLGPGSRIVVETRTHIYTYELDNSPADLTVKNTDTWVLDPVPGSLEQPTRALITLTTCEDFFTSPDRSIGFGHLVDTQTK
jgi:sortase A